KRYSESHEDGRAIIADGMEVKRSASIPMSAMWTPNPFINQNSQKKYEADIRESASVAHIYGQNVVAAESFTALGFPATAWSYSPENLKSTADLELSQGLNRFVIHTSVHQPVDDKFPGIGLGPFGQWFNRHDTWSEYAKAWTDYLSRSCYMLQQGKFVADVLVYYGEDNNITALYKEKLPDVPEGYNYDFINSDALVNLLTVKDGNLVTPSGMSYRLLVLDSNAVKLPVPVLTKIRDLVKAGATISGVKPTSTPSLSDDAATFKTLVNEVWNSGNPRVITGKNINEALKGLSIPADFTYNKPKSDTKLSFVHRKLENGDIYWVNNRSKGPEQIEATFRVAGMVPEVWHPETGMTEQVSYNIDNGLTKVTLDLSVADAVFIVFREKSKSNLVTLPQKAENVLATLSGEWNIAFLPGRGAPANIKVQQLKSWTENTDAGVKYFSGTGTYTKEINAPKIWFNKGEQLLLDLGEVKNLAEVIVNGKSLGVVWRKPFRMDITDALKQGSNKLEIKVTNLWVNRLIGDQQPGITKAITYTTQPFYQAGSTLQPSGLLGPAQIISIRKVDALKVGDKK
ncbi:MAG: glycoside hydrolase, partial [Marivirga sp.]|nr:glycoside hydrolase [Marivirga sp.]